MLEMIKKFISPNNSLQANYNFAEKVKHKIYNQKYGFNRVNLLSTTLGSRGAYCLYA